MLKELTTEELNQRAPAIFTGTHAMSERYAQIKTTDLLDRLSKSGYVPVDASQDNPSRRDPALVAHLVTLRHKSFIGVDSKAEEVPQILLVNSHNGRTKLRLYAGFYRFACANGLVIGQDQFKTAIKHTGDALEDTGRFADEMATQLTSVGEVIDDWKAIELSNTKANNFARKAAALRFGDRSHVYDVKQILAPKRPEDEGRSLWNVFNVVQENTTQGGIGGESATGRKISSRKLGAIQPNIAFNRQLWDLAQKVAA